MKYRILSFISAFALFTLMACGDSSSPDQGPPNQTPHTQQQQQQPVPPVSLPVSPADQQITQLGTLGDLTAEQIHAILDNRENIKAELLRRLTAHDLETLNPLLNQTQGITPVQTYVSAFLAMRTVDYAAARDAARGAAREAAGNAAWRAALVFSDAAWVAAWNASLAAAYDAARDAARNAAYHVARNAAYHVARNAASNAAQPLITAGLGVLHLEDVQEAGRTAYALSELLILNWLLQNNRIYFENSFNAARVALGADVTLERAREIVHRAIGRENLNTNPFIMQMRSFMDGVDQRITALPVQ